MITDLFKSLLQRQEEYVKVVTVPARHEDALIEVIDEMMTARAGSMELSYKLWRVAREFDADIAAWSPGHLMPGPSDAGAGLIIKLCAITPPDLSRYPLHAVLEDEETIIALLLARRKTVEDKPMLSHLKHYAGQRAKLIPDSDDWPWADSARFLPGGKLLISAGAEKKSEEETGFSFPIPFDLLSMDSEEDT